MDSSEEKDEVSDINESCFLSETKIALKPDILAKKKAKTGVVYLSFIPPYMTADILRRMLSKYAHVGRIFIQVIQDPGGKCFCYAKLNFKFLVHNHKS